ncbi:MAG TPA: CbtA family protein, partial [Rhizomicrobium sp.]|nr:CbtA family protein [Rhizomicrobium sp.]
MAGLIAGVIAFGYAELVGEPSVEQAIAFEAKAAAQRGEKPEPAIVSREVQRGWGLFTGIVVYATALGGLFSLA